MSSEEILATNAFVSFSLSLSISLSRETNRKLHRSCFAFLRIYAAAASSPEQKGKTFSQVQILLLLLLKAFLP
jgi:hypothetical protein